MKLPCSIIEDILPLYADNICSEESRQAVDEHCADCMDCSEKLRAMKAVLPESKLEGKPVNPVRKIAAHYVRLSAVTILGCLIVFSLIFLRMNGDISEKITAKSCERAMNDFALHLEKQEYTEAFKDMDFLCYWKENPADEFDYSEEELELVRGDFAKLFEDFLSMYPATSHSVSTDKRYYGLVGLLDVDFDIPGNARHIIRFEFFYH
ncbi:MAG: zf-HC2 domain-containing protein, partial [Huintestinicola sp.]